MSQAMIRSARPDDRDAVFEISATVWDGHDYLPQVWDSWMAESVDEGFLTAAEIDGKLVGIQHTALQPGGVAWMEGIRVHPDFRGRGIAGAMLDAALATARSLRVKTARLSTAHVNEASSKIALARGFREMARFHIFTASPVDGEIDQNVSRRPVAVSDIKQLRRRQGTDSPLIVNQWSAYELPGQKAPTDFEIHLVHDGDGERHGIGLASLSRDHIELSIAYLEGSVAAMLAIAKSFRAIAHAEDLSEVFAMLPERDDVFQAMEAAGFERDERLYVLVFELGLRPV